MCQNKKIPVTKVHSQYSIIIDVPSLANALHSTTHNSYANVDFSSHRSIQEVAKQMHGTNVTLLSNEPTVSQIYLCRINDGIPIDFFLHASPVPASPVRDLLSWISEARDDQDTSLPLLLVISARYYPTVSGYLYLPITPLVIF